MSARRAATLPQLAQQSDEGFGRRQALAQVGAARPQRKAAVHVLDRGEQSLAAFDGAAAAGADRAQRQPLAVVASEPRPQSGAQERRFSGARGAENDEKARRLARRKPAQRVDAAHDVGAATEEDGGILRLERLKPAIRRPPAERTVRVRLQLEGLGADAGLVEPALEALEAGFGDMDGRLMRCERMNGEETLGRLAFEANDLPLRGQPAGQAVERDIVDQQREQLFVEPVGELIFVAAPFRGEPFLRDEEQHRLAAGRRLFERVRPALAGGDAALGIEIEKNVVGPAPAFADEPILQRDRPVVILARMADEKA